jgi:meiotic recombination protein DMC1
MKLSTKKEMLNIKGITEQKAEKIYEAAAKIETMSFQTGMAILEKRKKIRRITTGSRQFDILLCKIFKRFAYVIFRGWNRKPGYH